MSQCSYLLLQIPGFASEDECQKACEGQDDEDDDDEDEGRDENY